MNEEKDSLLASLKKGLEKELVYLKKEKTEERKKYESEVNEIIKKELAESGRKNTEKIKSLENKLTKFYYWLFGIVFVLLIIIGGTFFYLRGSAGK